VACVRILSWHCLVKPRKITKMFRVTGSGVRYLNAGPPEYEMDVKSFGREVRYMQFVFNDVISSATKII
jgi:hypothetical protein